MSDNNEDRRKQQEAERRLNEELRRIEDERKRQERLIDNLKKGRPRDERPDRDD